MEIPKGTVVCERVESRALEGNLPGDPHVRDLYLYLPPGYEKAPERYPVACHSGDLLFEHCYKRDFGPAIRTIAKKGGVDSFLKAFRTSPKKEHADIGALNILAMAAAYSPNVKAPPPWCDLPFDLTTGELIESVWKLWLTWDPLFMIDRHAEAFRGLRLLFLDCGKDDEFYLELGARAFVKKLRAMGIAHEYEEFEDGHMSISYRMDRSLPKLSHALAR